MGRPKREKWLVSIWGGGVGLTGIEHQRSFRRHIAAIYEILGLVHGTAVVDMRLNATTKSLIQLVLQRIHAGNVLLH